MSIQSFFRIVKRGSGIENTGLLIDGEVFYCSHSAASFSQAVRKYLGLVINLQYTHPPTPQSSINHSYLHHILIKISFFVLFFRTGWRTSQILTRSSHQRSPNSPRPRRRENSPVTNSSSSRTSPTWRIGARHPPHNPWRPLWKSRRTTPCNNQTIVIE
jgi:hypothetical protein